MACRNNVLHVSRIYYLIDTEGDWIPVLRLLPSHQRSYKLFINCCKAMEEFITKQINKRKKKITATGEDDCKQDFIQLYLKELQNAKSGTCIHIHVV